MNLKHGHCTLKVENVKHKNALTNTSFMDLRNVKIRLAVICKLRILRFFNHIISKDKSSLDDRKKDK